MGFYIYTIFALCHLDRNGNQNGRLLKFLRILIKVEFLKDLNWVSKTVHRISCSMVCKMFFDPNFLIFWITRAKSRKEEGEDEHRQLQSVMRLTQTQKKIHIFICNTHIFFLYKELFFKWNIHFLHKFLFVKTLFKYEGFFSHKKILHRIYIFLKKTNISLFFLKKKLLQTFATSEQR